MTVAGGTLSDMSTCEASMRLASKASGTTSVAPAVLSSSSRESSGVRTSTGTSVRSRRRLRRMASEVRVSENEMTTAFAFARPTSSSTCSSAESPYTTGWPICRAARTRTASRSMAMYSKPCASSTRADVLADAAEAAEDHVFAFRHGLRDRVLAFDRGLRRAALAQQQPRDAFVVGEDHRREHHAEHHGHEQRLRDGRVDGLVLQQQREQARCRTRRRRRA